MAFQKGQNPNHPKKGASTKAEPLRDIAMIERIKQSLLAKKQFRNYALFGLGINTGLRASELLSLRIYQVKYLTVGDVLDVKQSKTQDYRMIVLNKAAVGYVRFWLSHHPHQYGDNSYLFPSLRYGKLGVPALSRLVKRWCTENGCYGRFSSHSLRKTWGYDQRINGASLALIARAYGHTSEAQTLRYIGITDEEVRHMYLRRNL